MTQIQSNSTVAAVVVTFNRKELLCQCLDGILAQSRPVDALFVIDNASTDGTCELIQERYGSTVKYVRLPDNLGGAGGFNRGMQIAYDQGFDYIWITDDDVLPAQTCLGLLFAETGGARVVSPLHVSVEGKVVEGAQFRVEGRKRWAREDRVCNRYDDPSLVPPKFEVSTVTFEGPLIHRSVIEMAGLPRADFFILFDDSEYSMRVSHLNLGPIICVAGAIMTRLLIAPDLPPWRSYHLWRNRLHSLRRYEEKLVWKLAIDGHFFLAYLKGLILGRNRLEEVKVRFDAWRDSNSNSFWSRYPPPATRK